MLAPASAAMLVWFSGCSVDERYSSENLKNLNPDVTLFENGISIPLIQSTANITVDSVFRLAGLDTTAFADYVKVGEDGNYYITYEQTISLNDALKDLNLNEFVKIGSVRYSQSVNYELGTADAATFKTDAEHFEEHSTLDTYQIAPEIDPISESRSILSLSNIQASAAAAKSLGQSTFDLGSTSLSNKETSWTIPAFKLPAHVKTLKSATLKTGAAIKVEMSVPNCILSEGTVIADIKADMSRILKLSDGSTTIDLSTLTLNQSNGYSTSATYPIASLNVSEYDREKTVEISGHIGFSNAVASVAKAEAAISDMVVKIDITFQNFEIQEAIATVEGISYEYSIKPAKLTYEIPQGVGNYGQFTILPQGNPTIEVNFNMPETEGINLKSDDGILFKIPSFIKLGTTPAGLFYDEAESTLFFHASTIRTAVYQIPVRSLVVSPTKVGDKFVVEDEYYAKGNVNIADGDLDLMKLCNLSGADMSISVNIPEIKAQSLSLSELSIDVNEKANFSILESKDIPDMLAGIPEVSLRNTEMKLNLALSNLPDIGNGKYHVNLNASLPDFIKPSSISIDKDLNADGSLEAIVPIEGLDLSMYDFAKLKAENGKIEDEITISGKIAALDPTVDINGLSGKVSGEVGLLIADSMGKESINIDYLKARVDYRKDSLFKIPFLSLPESLESCMLDLPEVKLCADITTNLGIPANAEIDLNEGMYKMPLTFPYSDNPDNSLTEHNELNINLNPFIESKLDTIPVLMSIDIDKAKDCLIHTGASYDLDVNLSMSAPFSLGEESSISYADTVAIGDSASQIGEILEKSAVQLYGKVENTMPFSIGVKVELLSLDDQTGEYSQIELTNAAESILAKPNEESDFAIAVKVKEGANAQALSHIKFSITLGSNGSQVTDQDFVALKGLGIKLPEGITISFDDDKNHQ